MHLHYTTLFSRRLMGNNLSTMSKMKDVSHNANVPEDGQISGSCLFLTCKSIDGSKEFHYIMTADTILNGQCIE